MSDPYLGEIRRVAFTFAPRNWALCDGQLLQIATNQALFSVLGTIYGGDGVRTFALPNLQGRTPRGAIDSSGWGRVEGEEFHRLAVSEMPTHTHQVKASNAPAAATSPAAAYWATTEQAAYGGGQAAVQLRQNAVAPAGQTAPHENRPPFLVVNFIIAINGVYPSRG